MAEDVPDSPPSRSAGKGIGSKLTHKLGPLPVWAWGLAGVALAYLGYRYYESKSAASAATTAASTAVGAGTTGTGAPTDTGGGGGYSEGGSGQLATLAQELAQIQTQLGTGGGGSGGGSSTPGYQQLTTEASIRANAANLYTQSAPGVFTKFTGALTSSPGGVFAPGNTTLLYAPVNGSVSGAAAPTTNTTTAAGSGAITTPPPAVSPVTSGAVGQSLGGNASGGNHIGPV